MDIQDDIVVEDLACSVSFEDTKRIAMDAFFIGQVQGLYEQGIDVCSLRYDNDLDNQLNGKKFKIAEMLDANSNIGKELYPNFEFMSVEPEINNFENRFDMTEIATRETISSNKILMEDVPIEYKHVAYKIANILPSNVKKVKFVSEITAEPEWTNWRRAYYKGTGFEKPEDEAIILGMISRDSKNNRDRIFAYNSTMFIDYTIGRRDGLFEDILSDEISTMLLSKDSVKQALSEDYSDELEQKDMTLKADDIEYLSKEDVILPILDKTSSKSVGWQINKAAIIEDSSIYAKMIREAQLVGGKWNLNGNPLFHVKNISSMNKFLSNEIKQALRTNKRSKRVDKVLKYL